MNTNLKVGGIFLAGVVAGTLPARLLGDDPAAADRLEFQNARLYVARSPLADGGVSLDVRFDACGYLYRPDAGEHYAEPCWAGTLPDDVAQRVAGAVLDAYKP